MPPPQTVSVRGFPKRASIRLSPSVNRAPTASAAEKTTPITVSVAMRVFDSTTQIRNVPSSSVAVPPSNG
jgi:hypothetical protein